MHCSSTSTSTSYHIVGTRGCTLYWQYIIYWYIHNNCEYWITDYDFDKDPGSNVTVLNNKSCNGIWFFSHIISPSPLLPPSLSLFLGFYSAKADMVIYCGHPSLILIHHWTVARQSWQQLFAFEFDRGAVSQWRQVKSITNAQLSRRIINQRRER